MWFNCKIQCRKLFRIFLWFQTTITFFQGAILMKGLVSLLWRLKQYSVLFQVKRDRGGPPVLSLTTLRCTLPPEWATHACITFNAHPRYIIHLHFHPLKFLSKSAPLTQNMVLAKRVQLTWGGVKHRWERATTTNACNCVAKKDIRYF